MLIKNCPWTRCVHHLHSTNILFAANSCGQCSLNGRSFDSLLAFWFLIFFNSRSFVTSNCSWTRWQIRMTYPSFLIVTFAISNAEMSSWCTYAFLSHWPSDGHSKIVDNSSLKNMFIYITLRKHPEEISQICWRFQKISQRGFKYNFYVCETATDRCFIFYSLQYLAINCL